MEPAAGLSASGVFLKQGGREALFLGLGSGVNRISVCPAMKRQSVPSREDCPVLARLVPHGWTGASGQKGCCGGIACCDGATPCGAGRLASQTRERRVLRGGRSPIRSTRQEEPRFSRSSVGSGRPLGVRRSLPGPSWTWPEPRRHAPRIGPGPQARTLLPHRVRDESA